MPIYEYQCEVGHIVEEIRKIDKRDTNLPNCEECQFMYADELSPIIYSTMYPIYSLPAKIGTPDDSKKSFVYFENKKGEVDFTSTPEVYHRPGFEKKEARNLYEREAIEKKLRQKDDLRLSVQFEKQDYTRHYSTKKRHEEFRNAINQGVIVEKDKDGNTNTTHLDEQTKDFAKLAMERTNNIAPKRRNSELKFDVNHNDKSTRNSKE